MDAPTALPHSRLRGIGLGLAVSLCLGMSCDQGRDPRGLPAPRFTDIRLGILDPDRRAPAAFLSWSYSGGSASYFEIYQSLSLDSLRTGKLALPAMSESLGTMLALPDLARPFTVYYAVRAIQVEATGQKLVSDSLAPDSLVLTPSLSILDPAAASAQTGRLLSVQVQTQSDPGVTLRMAYYEKRESSWEMRLDTCLPMDACGVPVFGRSLQQESIVLTGAEDTLTALFCVIGTESFPGQRTGLAQSLSCNRFFRTGP